ncbi:hypothetical protein ACFYRC_37190 [Streptomyces sp. NPDC005279]
MPPFAVALTAFRTSVISGSTLLERDMASRNTCSTIPDSRSAIVAV